MLDSEVSKKLEIKLSCAQALQSHKDECFSIFPRLDYNHLTSFILRINEKKAQSYRKKHSKKLFAFGFEYQHKLLGPEDVIFNFSKHKLSEPEKDALSLGLKYCFNPIKLDYVDFFLSFEKLSRKLSQNPMFSEDIDSCNRINASLKQMALSTFHSFKSKTSPHERKTMALLKNLGSNKDLVITRPDKGNGVVIVDKQDYLMKMQTVLDDYTKFTKLKEDWKSTVFKYQDKVSRFVDKLHKSGIIAEEEKANLKTSGSRLGIMYGLPKIHKAGLPMRPILSTVNSYNYLLSKYLIELLKPITGGAYTVKDSFAFSEEISKLRNSGYSMASFDVVSLFTNIPVGETIEIILDKIFVSSSTLYKGFDRKTFKQLLEVCNKDNVFISNQELYKQIDVAPMARCVSPTIAESCLCFCGKKW